jgi:hypothetical protein
MLLCERLLWGRELRRSKLAAPAAGWCPEKPARSKRNGKVTATKGGGMVDSGSQLLLRGRLPWGRVLWHSMLAVPAAA